jgi:hypothetical protein
MKIKIFYKNATNDLLSAHVIYNGHKCMENNLQAAAYSSNISSPTDKITYTT